MRSGSESESESGERLLLLQQGRFRDQVRQEKICEKSTLKEYFNTHIKERVKDFLEDLFEE